MEDPAAVASDILKQHGDGALPVNLEYIARNLGVRLRPFPAETRYSTSLTTDGHDRPVIFYNPYDTSIRRRFAVAHGLGHFVLKHTDMPPDMAASFSHSIDHPQERAANEFAMALLIPQPELKTLVYSGKFNADELCLAFGVSAQALSEMIIRLPSKTPTASPHLIKQVASDVGTAAGIVAEVAALKLLV